MSLLSRIAYRLNAYKGTIRFAIAGLSKPPPEIVSPATIIHLRVVKEALNELHKSIDLDYKLYKWRLRNETDKNSIRDSETKSES